MLIPSLLTFSLLFVTSSAASVNDFCVAELSLPDTPSGFPCKDPDRLTSDDFTFSGLGVPENTSNIFKSSLTRGSTPEFPGVNGLGVSIARVDIAPGGVFPAHTHRGANEILLVESGTIFVGFISSDNVVYSTTLNRFDLFIFPKGLIHFLVNTGEGPAVAFASFSSSSPGIQFLDLALFGSSLPSKLVEAITLLDASQVKKLKKVFGGSD